MPKAIVGDEAFFREDFLTYYRTHGIKECPCGSRTPWPNRAESVVRLFNRQWQTMSKKLEDDRFEGVTVREAVKRTVWARNNQLTVSGYSDSPLEIATGRRPPDLLDIETSDPAQLSADPLPEDRTQQELQRLALKAHQEARQAADLRHDMAKRTMPSDGPYKPGDKVFVWTAPPNANDSKAWKKERWIRGTVISQEGAVVNVHVDDAVRCVNQSKVRHDHDEWHDVAVTGLDTSEPVPLAVEDEDDYEPDIAEYAEAYLGEQAIWFVKLASVMLLNSSVATLVSVGTWLD